MASADRPTDEPETKLVETSLTCKRCGDEWEATSLMGGSLEQWVAWLETHKCPSCQQNYVVEHQKPRAPETYLTLPPIYLPPKPPQ